jgi:membrane-associated protease RseP (regulator of RpoE activity)
VAKVLAAPGRYRFSGAVGDATIERDFTVSPGQQRVVLEPPPLRCFTASYVDRKTGEELEGTITAYERVGSGYQPLQLAKVGPRSSECFDAARVATLALSSDGYVPVVMNAGSEDLGVVALTAAESGSRVLADAVELDDSGGFVVRGGEIEAIGLRPGDRLVSIEGTSVAGLVLDEVSARLEGPTGSVVKLTVRGSDGVRELALARP